MPGFEIPVSRRGAVDVAYLFAWGTAAAATHYRRAMAWYGAGPIPVYPIPIAEAWPVQPAAERRGVNLSIVHSVKGEPISGFEKLVLA